MARVHSCVEMVDATNLENDAIPAGLTVRAVGTSNVSMETAKPGVAMVDVIAPNPAPAVHLSAAAPLGKNALEVNVFLYAAITDKIQVKTVILVIKIFPVREHAV